MGWFHKWFHRWLEILRLQWLGTWILTRFRGELVEIPAPSVAALWKVVRASIGAVRVRVGFRVGFGGGGCSSD